jgi:membrane-associated protease RseP (regulator of RpoE activity)
MAATEPPADGPPSEAFDGLFEVYDVRHDGDRLLYFGRPVADSDEVVRQLWPQFRDAGYELHHHERLGEHVLVAEPRETEGGVPWTNVVLFVATVLSTLFVGAVGWYFVPPGDIADDPLLLLRAWPFTAAVLGVLGVHELGHYVMSRYHDVEASLPYFIPVPTIFGTMGAVIRMRGKMPDRKALFDIGVAGPVAGLVATVAVTAIGLTMDPVSVPESVLESSDSAFVLANPPLLEIIAGLLGADLEYGRGMSVNPVVIGGWVGMFVTFLNLIPVGQLDGGHMLRAMLGRQQERLNVFVPLGIFGVAAFLYYGLHLAFDGSLLIWTLPEEPLGFQDSVLLWTVWGGFATLLAFNGPATPVEEDPLGWRRQLLGVLTFAVGLLCFTPVPFRLLTG